MMVVYQDTYGEILFEQVDHTSVPRVGEKVLLGSDFFVSAVEWDVYNGKTYVILGETPVGGAARRVANTVAPATTNQTTLARTAMNEARKTSARMKSLTEQVNHMASQLAR